ncbi:hypothetical protein W02_36240 [Nitrospira sp. KM1]|uniref:nuclease-related domain-containing protein n=1 Tax=Nitrospira sp. KM1 TaxID=1936990 RepID=UPI0013A7154E|nr:nuclease-related domain-containing protein [Nitrospira sp. KM1]BCA56484.1 hypothetical protein W02_36240 [Nitrospira sp. KM1]
MSQPISNVLHQPRYASPAVQPLRLPGQSIDEQISRLKDEILDLLLIPLCLVVLAGYEWIQYWMGRPISPLILTTLALMTIVYAWKQVLPLKTSITHLRIGRDGERIVGQMLEELRRKDYRVFHDVPGNGFNIDHVIIGPAGVFTIESKTRNKPRNHAPKILFDGNSVRVANAPPSNEPVTQARSQAKWLAGLLNDGRKRIPWVRPIVMFPDWWVERVEPSAGYDVWVINPKEVWTFLYNERQVLSAEAIDTLASALAMYCRCTPADSGWVKAEAV